MAAENEQRVYSARKIAVEAGFPGRWDDAGWGDLAVAEVDQFHAKSSGHRPVTRVKLGYTEGELRLYFRVADRYVACRRWGYQEEVWKDSCVEFFVQPVEGKGYFNFEMNCGGAMVLYYIEDARRTAEGFKKFTVVPWEVGKMVKIVSSMPVERDKSKEEIGEAVEWSLQCAIPFGVLEKYVGSLGKVMGEQWRGNFYKCAEDCSGPHWASWSPIGEEWNFHQPGKFGVIEFV